MSFQTRQISYKNCILANCVALKFCIKQNSSSFHVGTLFRRSWLAVFCCSLSAMSKFGTTLDWLLDQSSLWLGCRWLNLFWKHLSPVHSYVIEQWLDISEKYLVTAVEVGRFCSIVSRFHCQSCSTGQIRAARLSTDLLSGRLTVLLFP